MNLVKELNPFSLGLSLLGYNKVETPQDLAQSSQSINEVTGTFEFGPMTLSKKFIVLEKKASYCIVPPTPIMPGRKRPIIKISSSCQKEKFRDTVTSKVQRFSISH